MNSGWGEIRSKQIYWDVLGKLYLSQIFISVLIIIKFNVLRQNPIPRGNKDPTNPHLFALSVEKKGGDVNKDVFFSTKDSRLLHKWWFTLMLISDHHRGDDKLLTHRSESEILILSLLGGKMKPTAIDGVCTQPYAYTHTLTHTQTQPL